MQRTQSIEINLLQMRSDEVKGGSPLIPALLVVLFGTAAIAMGWMWMSAKAAISQTNGALERVNAQIKENQAKLANTPTIGGAADFISLPQTLTAGRPNATEVLDKLTPLMPTASNLTTLSFGDGNTLKVTGNFASSEDVISFMQAVKSSSAFSLVATSGMTKIPAVPEDKNAPAATDVPLPVIQATFDLKYTADANKKG